MDIAKIRKKAREKEKKAAEEHKETAEERGPGLSEEQAGDGDAFPGAGEEDEQQADAELIEESFPAVETPEEEAAGAASGESGEEPDEEEASPQGEPGNVLELLTFVIAGREFAFRIADVEEIIPYQGITPVPLLPDYVSGIMSLRGKIIPVIDLKSRFALGRSSQRGPVVGDPATNGGKEKILILAGAKGLIGATVDRIRGVMRFSEDSVLAPPAHLTEEERRFIDGVVIDEKRFISVVRFSDAIDIEAG